VKECEGKTAVVTGGAGNIGRACAAALAASGARVVVADLDESGAKQSAERIVEAGGVGFGTQVDLADEQSIRALIETALDQFGRLDILHNNAAATLMARSRDAGVADMDMEVWDYSLRVNLRAPLLAARAAIPHMKANGGGCIINTVSGAGTIGDLRHTAYGVSKAGLMQLTRAIATQHGVDGIRCNAVCPGFISSEDPNREGAAQHSQELLEHNLIGRLGLPTDIANAVVFLASERSAFMTGQIVVVDGGASVHGPNYPRALRRREELATSVVKEER
jgi:NAD(P)-dependent dehydrogenase (short-subunit alcohol dehydrogenase family)